MADEEKFTALPLARVKKIVKMDKDITTINHDTAFCLTKATELFVDYLVSEAYQGTQREKRKILQYKDLAKVVKELDNLEFLQDIVPEKKTPNN